MPMPTESQRVQILVHYAWDLRDEGLDDAAVVRRLIEEGAPQEIAEGVLGLIDEEVRQLVHDHPTRDAIVLEIEKAVESEDYEALSTAMSRAVEDERTLQKVYCRLSDLLPSDSHKKGMAAAFGLSLLVGRGDWPLIQALSHNDENVRFRAAFALGNMGKAARNAIEPLKTALSDSDEYTREAASDALAAIRADMKPWWKFW
ncbi:MAG: HEAT repeat domain-containing protein [Pirellulales bacterium]|nr:HEAT repeat domain-containing protein [Pirellulales bacterium]